MCGIFALCATPESKLTPGWLRRLTDRLFLLSESRGKEAAGIAVRANGRLVVYKQPMIASRLIRDKRFQRIFQPFFGGNSQRLPQPVTILGHSRLATNGIQTMNENNQPVVKDGLVCVHNGIISNDELLWKQFGSLERKYQVDTEVLLSLLRHFGREGKSFQDAVRAVYRHIEGTASILALGDDLDCLLAATNCGSLYLCRNGPGNLCIAASERHILEMLLKSDGVSAAVGPHDISQVRPGQAYLINLRDLKLTPFALQPPAAGQSAPETAVAATAPRIELVDHSTDEERARAALRRCSRCILPETMPFISFDAQGVCSYCHSHKKQELLGLQALQERVAPFRGKNGAADCIVMFSGGRDSCYGLHFIKRVLKLNPIAFTYDWGVITDLGRRNQARLCGALGVEHVVVSADIARKRANIRKNIAAWLKRPDLGMIPLFMAGDKQYYYYANRLRRQTGIQLTVVCECPLELSRFKAGFCGINEADRRIFDISIWEKLKLAKYYAMRYLCNPAYINQSLLDSVFAFFAAYLMRHDYLFLYNYVPWVETEIAATLRHEYNWELAPDTPGTWRIGDGTAPFYNYIYHTVAGVTENDTLRSNQIREGVLTREEALRLVAVENRPRWESMLWYAQTIGIDLQEALGVIHGMRKLYRV